MLARRLALAALTASLFAPLSAESIDGYLVDKQCSAKIIEGGAAAGKAHTKECLLSDACKASGYGVVTEDGKFIKFDPNGDKLVQNLMDVLRDKDDLKVNVQGPLSGDRIVVKALQKI